MLREAWAGARDRLADAGIADASLEAEVLLRTALGVDRTGFLASLGETVPNSRLRAAEEVLARRLGGEPLAYIVGTREFYGLELAVDPSVLIPRQETEHLVDAVVDYSRRLGDPPLDVADVGTGSGAIAVAVAHRLPAATVYATDISGGALEVADANRRRHGLDDRVHLREGDLLDALPGPVDVIVSNPPYIPTGDLPSLPPDVRREPAEALDGGPDGLSTTRRLIRGAPDFLRPGGRLLVEIAPEQLSPVIAEASDTFPGADVSFERDLSGNPRMLVVDASGPAAVQE